MTFIENKMKLGEMKTLYAERIFFLGIRTCLQLINTRL